MHAVGFSLFLLKWVFMNENPLSDLKSAPMWFLAAGLFGISFHEVTWVAALQQAPPLEATMIIYTWPLLVVIFSAKALGQKLRWYHLLGGILGLMGIFIMLLGRGLSLDHMALKSGHLWAILCSLSWSVFSAISARYDHFSINLLSFIFLVSSLINLVIWFFIFDSPPAPFSSLVLVGVAAIFTSSGYMLWDFGMKRGNAPFIGIVSFLTPVLAALFLVAIGKATLNAHLLLALTLVMLGIGITKYGGCYSNLNYEIPN